MTRFLTIVIFAVCSTGIAADLPKCLDDRLTIELFSEHPQIVTPTGLAVDNRGRVFVGESHTHFRPDDYDGPKADRILILEDTDGDGRADKKTVFHEGFKYIMDIEFHYDGSLYVATRWDIHRMRDTNGDNQADEITPIVKLETKGDYPHNGISGIAFDLRGGFNFGLGENLGEPYTLIGSDGTRISGGGEGGSTYWSDDDGKRLRRVTTGWWNPYGMCTDSYGRIFGTDNDPDASPPCRLIQVVEGGDYGYEFRYGRSGLNPLITWDGEIPGTLPMIAGTGEAPCHIVAYESDALPEKYFGSLLVSVWADHRVEYYVLEQKPDRGLVSTQRQTLVEGPDDFRPVGIDVASDGTVYISDWVSSSYTLHKQGRVWRIRPKQMPTEQRPTVRVQQLHAADRRVREAAARELVRTPSGKAVIANELRKSIKRPAAAATCLQVLAAHGNIEIAKMLEARDQWPSNRKPLPLEVRLVIARICAAAKQPSVDTRISVWAEYLQHASRVENCVNPFRSGDPYIQHFAIKRLGELLAAAKPIGTHWGGSELHELLAWKYIRNQDREYAETRLEKFLASKEPIIRFMAVKWVADDKLVRFRPQLEKWLASPDLDLRTFLAINVALQRLEGKPPTDRPAPQPLLERIADAQASPAIRRHALRLIDPAFPGLKRTHLSSLLADADVQTRFEAVQTLAEHPDDLRFPELMSVLQDVQQPSEVRAAAAAGLAGRNTEFAETLVELAGATDDRLVRDEILRTLVGIELSEVQRTKLGNLSKKDKRTSAAVTRLLERKVETRPAATETEAWLDLLAAEKGDAKAGERIFFGTRVGLCAKCHQADGRGAAVGPDLSRMSQRVRYAGSEGKRWLLETILQPSREMAPQYTPWMIVTKDGKQQIGLPRRKGGKGEAYLGIDGKEFSLKVDDIEFHRESDVSIMPTDLLQQLTDQELADLFAFLTM